MGAIGEADRGISNGKDAAEAVTARDSRRVISLVGICLHR